MQPERALHASRPPTLARLLAAIALVSLASACGGATPAAHAPKQHADETPDNTGPATSENAPATPQPPNCDDGTCFPCGDGICPKGFYCDRKAPDGPACSWLPACAKQASCSCVTKTLGSGCTCQSENGGVYVDCD